MQPSTFSGPPKHYTSTLERRLVETEDVLFALISQVSEDQLVSAFAPLHHHQPEGTEGYSGGESLFEAIRKQKFGPAYWTNFPLGSAQDVRQWWADRESLSLKGSHHPDADNEGRGDGAEKQLDTSEVDGDLESPVLSLGDRVEQEQEQEQDWGRREASASRSAGSTHDSTTTTFSPRGAIDQEETAARARTSQALPSGEEDENMESAYLW